MTVSSLSCDSLILEPIGQLVSPFTEKFGIPRQANLIESAYAEIELYTPYNNPDAALGLESFSHIWLIFGFHLNYQEKWRPMIRPPRMGGNKKIGVFASRSPFRPNKLGQSLVKLHRITKENNQAKLIISCPDLLNGTPIYDIKPYIHYADSADDSRCAYAQEQPTKKLNIEALALYEENLKTVAEEYPEHLNELIKDVIAYDPRPAYKQGRNDDKTYVVRVYDLDISFVVQNDTAVLQSLEKIK